MKTTVDAACSVGGDYFHYYGAVWSKSFCRIYVSRSFVQHYPNPKAIWFTELLSIGFIYAQKVNHSQKRRDIYFKNS
jgi:hypothetical protein